MHTNAQKARLSLLCSPQVGVNYRLCADLDGGFTEQGFLDVGSLGLSDDDRDDRLRRSGWKEPRQGREVRVDP